MTVMNKWKVLHRGHICWPVLSLTPITGQSFLTSRFEDASNLSLSDPWQIKTIDARSDSGSEEFKLLRKFLSLSAYPDTIREAPHRVMIV